MPKSQFHLYLFFILVVSAMSVTTLSQNRLLSPAGQLATGGGESAEDKCPDVTSPISFSNGNAKDDATDKAALNRALAAAIEGCKKSAESATEYWEQYGKEKCEFQGNPPEYSCVAGEPQVDDDGKSCGYIGSCYTATGDEVCTYVVKDGAIDESTKRCEDQSDLDARRGTSCTVLGPRIIVTVSCSEDSSPPTLCGNGIVEEGEECDPPGSACTTIDGKSGICSDSCQCIVKNELECKCPEPPQGTVVYEDNCPTADVSTCREVWCYWKPIDDTIGYGASRCVIE